MFKIWLALASIGGMASLVAIAWLFCRQLLPLSRAIDKLGEWLGVIASWLVLLACLVSAINATVRYLISYSSNAWLELQWYMFAGMVLLGAAYTLKVNEHVRVDLIYGAISDRARHWIDLLGGAIFLTPMCLVMIWFTWPWFVQAWTLNESSSNAGGLIRWPVILLLPVGFALILLQGFSEMIKRAAALRGFHQQEYAYEKPLQ